MGMFKGISLDFSDVENDEKLENYEKEQERIKFDNCLRKYCESGVPNKFKYHEFKTFIATTDEEKHIKDVSMEFANNPRNRVLILSGKNGNGKTHLGSAILRQSIWNGNGGCYITASSLCVKYESAIGYKAPMSREEIIDFYSHCAGILVIDECCKYFINPDIEKFILVQIICNRYENDLPIVLITNADKKEFINFLGMAVLDRFTEVCTTLDFKFESKRKELRG